MSPCAAAGDNSWAGLPGVRPGTGRKVVQVQEKVGNLTLVSSCRGFEHIILDSVWFTRAWTFQEFLLAGRLLLFSDEQVFFMCDHAMWPEDLVLDAVPHAPAMLSNELWDRRPEFKEPRRDLDDILMYAANGIINRKLTYQIDRLNTFDGISQWIGKTRGVVVLQGLPVDVLEGALLFQGTQRYRRNCLPKLELGWMGCPRQRSGGMSS